MNEQERDETTIEQALQAPVADTQPIGGSAMPTMPVLPPQYTLHEGDTRVDPDPDLGSRDLTPPADVPVTGRGRRPLRVRTAVFGLVMLAISAVSLVALVTDIRVDGGIVGLGLLIGAGAALVAGGVSAAVREARGGPGAAH